MMNAKISQKHDNMYHIRKNYMLKSIYDDKNDCFNYTLSFIKDEETHPTVAPKFIYN